MSLPPGPGNISFGASTSINRGQQLFRSCCQVIFLNLNGNFLQIIHSVKFSEKIIRAASIFDKSTSEEGVAATVLGHVWYQEYPTHPARYPCAHFILKIKVNFLILQPHPERVHVRSPGSLGSRLCEGIQPKKHCQRSVQVNNCILSSLLAP